MFNSMYTAQLNDETTVSDPTLKGVNTDAASEQMLDLRQFEHRKKQGETIHETLNRDA